MEAHRVVHSSIWFLLFLTLAIAAARSLPRLAHGEPHHATERAAVAR